MIFAHWTQTPDWSWPNFTPQEMSCRHCGEYYHWPEFMDRLQALRGLLGQPLYINSAHRCWRHNLNVGGAPKSQHKTLAVDISSRSFDKHELVEMAKKHFFCGIGIYSSFIHLDLGAKRVWYG